MPLSLSAPFQVSENVSVLSAAKVALSKGIQFYMGVKSLPFSFSSLVLLCFVIFALNSTQFERVRRSCSPGASVF